MNINASFTNVTLGTFNQAANASNSTLGYGAQASEFISGVANKVSGYAAGTLTYVSDTASNAKDFVAYKAGNATEYVYNTAGNATQSVSSTFHNYTGNNTVIGNAYASAAQAVSDHSFGIKATGAAIGGTIAVNSAINLLQGRQNIQPTKEFAKVIAGTGLAALSLYASAEDELASLGNVALGAGLTTALVKVATYAKETFHIHMYKLKSKEASPDLQNVVKISTNS